MGSGRRSCVGQGRWNPPDGSTIGSCMPEPCVSRLNGNGHETVFRFVRTERASDAWTDTCECTLPRAGQDVVRYLPDDLMSITTSWRAATPITSGELTQAGAARDTGQTFPAALCERAIAMTCPPFVHADGSLPETVVEWVEYDEQPGSSRVVGKRALNDENVRERSGRNDVGANYIARKPGHPRLDPSGGRGRGPRHRAGSVHGDRHGWRGGAQPRPQLRRLRVVRAGISSWPGTHAAR